jgi:hypothetical protein
MMTRPRAVKTPAVTLRRILRRKQPPTPLRRRTVPAHLIHEKLPRKIVHIHVEAGVVRVAQPQQSLVDNVEQLGDVLERSRLVTVDDKFLALETGVEVETAELLVPIAGWFGAEDQTLGQDEGFELFDAGDLTAGLYSVGTLQPGSQNRRPSHAKKCLFRLSQNYIGFNTNGIFKSCNFF